MIPHIDAPEHNENPPALPTFENAKARRDWFIENALQQHFDVIANALNSSDARDSEDFLKFDLCSTFVQQENLATFFYEEDALLLLQLRFLGMVESYALILEFNENADRALAMNPQSVHDSEVDRTCALAVFKLRRLFFENEPIKEKYLAGEFIPLEIIQVHPEYQKTKKELDQVFSNTKALRQRLLDRLNERVEKKDFNDNVYFQLASRFSHLNTDTVSKEQFEENILKNKTKLQAFIQFVADTLSLFYHQRLNKELKGHLEPRKNEEIGIVLKDESIEGEVPNFYGTPEENLVLAWKMLHAEDECAPQAVQAEKTKIEQEKAREDLISDYLFHLAAVYREYASGSAACGQGTWVRIFDYFNEKYNEKILSIGPKKVDPSRITKEGVERHYSSYIEQALKDKRFEPHLGALYFGNARAPTAVQQALIGKIKEAFASLYRQQFNKLPEGYMLTLEDWIKLDGFLYAPIFTQTLQNEIRKIANPFLTEDTASILVKIQQSPEMYQPAFQALAGLIKAQDVSSLKQISDGVSSILQNFEDKHPRKEIAKKCEALLKTLNMPLVSFILPFQSRERLKTLLSKAKTAKKIKNKTFQKFLAEMDAVDKQLAEQYKVQSGQNRKPDKQHHIQNQHHLTVDYPKPSPHPLFELMGEQQAHVFWKDFVADAEIQAALLKQFPRVPLKRMKNPYTEQRLKCYTFESRPSKQKFDLTPKGLLLEQEQRISDRNAWDDSSLLEHAAESEYSEWLENLLKQHKDEIKQNPRVCLESSLGLAAVNHKLENVSCFLNFIKQEGIPIDETRSFWLLHGMCQYNATGAFGLLLKDDKNINLMIEDGKGNTPLHVACAFHNHEMVALLLGTGKVEINRKNQKGLTPLDLAYADSNRFKPSLIQLLLENHAKMNKEIKARGDNTLLQLVCFSGRPAIVKLLLASDDIDEDYIQHANTQGRTAFDYAYEHLQNNPKILSALLTSKKFKIPESTNINELLRDACKYGHVELVKQLLAHPKANVNPFQNHQNLFNIALEHEQFEVVKVLLEQPNIKFELFDPTYNIHVRDKLWGNLKSIYEKQHASGREAMYSEAQRRMQRAFALTPQGLSVWSVVSPLKGTSPLLPWWAASLLWPLRSVTPRLFLATIVLFSFLLMGMATDLIGMLYSPLLAIAATHLLFGGALPCTCYLVCGFICLFKGMSFESGVNLTVDLLLGPERIEKITLPEGKTFSDYQAWRRAVKRKLPREQASNSDYEKVGELYYRKKQSYVKKTQKKPDPFDYKEQHDQDVYLPSHKAGMLYLYTVQPNADDVRSDVFCAAKGNTPEFVKKLLKS